MAQGNYADGQTPLLALDVKTILQTQNSEYFKTAIDWFTPHKQALAAYAKAYTGDYYRKQGALTAFSAAWLATTYGSFFEEALPTDCIDAGIESVQVQYGASRVVPEANVVQSADETTWLTDSSNTTDVYFKVEGRKALFYIPTTYSSSTPLKWSPDYTRYPSFPQADADYIDIPAEDIDTYLTSYTSKVIIP